MKNKTIAVLSLAFLLSFDATVLANSLPIGTALNPDGPAYVTQRRRKTRARRRSPRRITGKVYGGVPRTETQAMPKGADMSPTSAAPPNIAPAPAPPAPINIEPRTPTETGPRIKPPSVQIKPPSE